MIVIDKPKTTGRYRRKQVEEMTGIPARRIQFYTEQGLLPMVDTATGRGKEREYSLDDVSRLSIIKGMAELGITLSMIKVYLNDENGKAKLINKCRDLMRLAE